jgi:hypothetical protein
MSGLLRGRRRSFSLYWQFGCCVSASAEVQNGMGRDWR